MLLTPSQTNERVYKAFLEILNMYRKEEKSISDVYEEVAQLFKHHPDLLEEFTHFLPDSAPPVRATPPRFGAHCPLTLADARPPRLSPAAWVPQAGAAAGPGPSEGVLRRVCSGSSATLPPHPLTTHVLQAAVPVKRKINRDVPVGRKEEANNGASLARELQFFERVKARLRNRDAYGELMKCMHLFNTDVITRMELRGLVYDILGKFPDLLAGFDDFVTRCEGMDFDLAAEGRGKLSVKDAAKLKVIAARDKFLSRPISELDLSMCERCGPSYRLLPKSFPKSPASGRTALHQAVLNDDWVSVTSGSEDFGFKAMRKNQYEESLFRCEDDRLELDMVIETNASALAVLQALAASVAALPAEHRAEFKLPDGCLSAVHLRAIERIYGVDHGVAIRDLVQRAPGVAVPVVVHRLAQKDAEWRRVREHMKAVWADVYEKNYSKSLDHRSFYFKQADKKALAAKGMVTEMKELSDKRKQAEEVPLGGGGAPGARTRGPSPDISFVYADKRVHDDVFAVLKFSAGEMMSDEQADKVLALWRNVVEPFFGLQRTGTEHLLDDVAERIAGEVSLAQRDEEEEGAADAGAGAAAAPAAAGSGEHHKTGLAAAVAAGGADDDDGGEDGGEDGAGDAKAGGGAAGNGPRGGGSAEAVDISGGEGDDDVAGQPGRDAEFGGCKPLSCVHDWDRAAQGSLARGAGAGAGGKTLYGHEAFFILFRLHRHLYERLAAARTAAAAAHEAGWAPTMEGGGGGAAGGPRDGASHHAQFLRLLFQLLCGSLDQGKYEDDCRAVLGANSFVLFTLDKLVYKLVKQLQALLTDDTAAKLLLLHSYETARLPAGGEAGGALDDAQYAADVGVLLGDEAAFRIATPDAGTTLHVQLMDSAPDAKPGDGGGGPLEPRFGDYLRSFMLSGAPPAGDKAGALAPPPAANDDDEEDEDGRDEAAQRRRIFLARTLRPPVGGTVRCVNGLECKVSCAHSKVSYVLDTEDVLVATHKAAARGGSAAYDAAAKQKFASWLEAQLNAPRGRSDPAAAAAAAVAAAMGAADMVM